MIIHIHATPEENGRAAAADIATRLRGALSSRDGANLLLSTGASQFEMFEALVREDVDWSRVTMFHLDEYVGLSLQHPASFRRYLQERFCSRVSLREAVFVDGEDDPAVQLPLLNARLAKTEIDVGVIGIGENGHIAFNDPPADFDCEDPYIVVTLDERCRQQQVGEGWFAGPEEVPAQAISMSVRQIMRSKCIISVVPHAVKHTAVRQTLTADLSPEVPATILRTHPDWTLYLDAASAGVKTGASA